MTKVLVWLETLFLISFWLQTRIDLSHILPWLSDALIISDYVQPFLYLSDIFFTLSFIIWLADWLVSSPKPTFSNLKISGLIKPNWAGQQWWVWFSLFLLAAAISLELNKVGWHGWWTWLKLIEGGVMVWFFSNRLQVAENVRRYSTILMIGLGVECLILIGEWLKQSSLGLQWLGEWRFSVHTPGVAKIIYKGTEFLRPMATFAHPNIAGGVLALAIAPILWYYRLIALKRNNVKGWHKMTVGFGCVLISIGLFVTFSRSAWLVAIVMIAWLGAVSFSSERQSYKSFLTSISKQKLGFGVAMGLMVVILISPLIVSRFSSLTSTDELSYQRRIQLMIVTQELWRQHLGFGVGLNNFIVRLAEFGPLFGVGLWRQPTHNFWLIVGVETGWVGLLCLIGFFTSIWSRIIHCWKFELPPFRLRLVGGVWIGWLILGLTDHYWWTSQQGMLVTWLICGTSLALTNNYLRTKHSVRAE